jgi:hypothetical protein
MNDVFLYTPLMLDIGYPLGEADTSCIREQVEVMSLISQLKNKSYALHAFVAFDPVRAKYEPDALQVVVDAVRNNGAIGVKIYPPMGFKPCGNSDTKVEQQMKLFLEFCLTEDVPILSPTAVSRNTFQKIKALAQHRKRGGPSYNRTGTKIFDSILATAAVHGI